MEVEAVIEDNMKGGEYELRNDWGLRLVTKGRH
jgi:hypothetical protein